MGKRKSVEELGKGILSNLEDEEEMDGLDEILEEEMKDPKQIEARKRAEEIESKRIKEEESKGVKEEKSKKKKRSFMLTDYQIQLLYVLKGEQIDKDLSTIVGEAIELYFDRTRRMVK